MMLRRRMMMMGAQSWDTYDGSYDGSWVMVSPTPGTNSFRLNSGVAVWPSMYGTGGADSVPATIGAVSMDTYDGVSGHNAGPLQQMLSFSGTHISLVGGPEYSRPGVGSYGASGGPIDFADQLDLWGQTQAGSPYNPAPTLTTCSSTTSGFNGQQIGSTSVPANGACFAVYNLDSTRALITFSTNGAGVIAWIQQRSGQTLGALNSYFTMISNTSGGAGNYGSVAPFNASYSVGVWCDSTTTGNLKVNLMNHPSTTVSQVTSSTLTGSAVNGTVGISEPLDGFGGTQSRFLVTWQSGSAGYCALVLATQTSLTFGTIYALPGSPPYAYPVKGGVAYVSPGILAIIPYINPLSILFGHFNAANINDLTLTFAPRGITAVPGGGLSFLAGAVQRISPNRLLIAAQQNGAAAVYAKIVCNGAGQ